MIHTFTRIGLAMLIGFSAHGQIQQLSATMVSRTARKGQVAQVKAELTYGSDGKMVTYFSAPFKQYLLNNTRGEVSIYDPEKNTVMLQNNYAYGTETSQLYFFLRNKKEDLGLRQMGFTSKDIRFENGLTITRWAAPSRLWKVIKEVELVHKGANPVYMKYVGAKGQVVKKVFFYQYQNLKGTDFPSSITQIDFVTPGDSILSKTSYENFRLNEAANLKLLQFSVPANAKVSR